MPIINDPEFGRIVLRRSNLAKQARLKLDAKGTVSISMPASTPIFIAKQLLNESRPKLRKLLNNIEIKENIFQEGDLIGRSHILRFETKDQNQYSFSIKSSELIIYHPYPTHSDRLNEVLKEGVTKILKTQAKIYLPKRLDVLATQYGFTYSKTRISNAGTRWGSCSNQGTISMNIWLMQLPTEIIDYVLIHELCHTQELNHSPNFWILVEKCCPNYKILRKKLKNYQPNF